LPRPASGQDLIENVGYDFRAHGFGGFVVWDHRARPLNYRPAGGLIRAVSNHERDTGTNYESLQCRDHPTRAVFDRYNVTSEADLADAARKIEAGKRVWAENGQNFDKMHKSRAAASLPVNPASAPN
jgi:hypothetical protein